jgi:nucleoside-diphosphate-sugar epimerase
MRGASSVVHLAGLVGDPACAVSPEFTRQSNIISTRLAKEVAEGLGIRRFVFASSCSVYGLSEQEVKEGDSLNPVSLYATTKIDSEKELLQSVRDEFIVTILRFATVFGHSQRPRFDLVGNLFAAQAWNHGEITVIGPDQWRPFIHVTDLARAIVLVLQSPSRRVQNQIFNVGDERLNLTILDLAKAVQKVCLQIGKNVKINIKSEGANDRRNYRVSFKKIKNRLKYSAETGVEDGIIEILQNFKKGIYKNYQDPLYSNLLTTKTLVNSGWRKSNKSLFTSLEENT